MKHPFRCHFAAAALCLLLQACSTTPISVDGEGAKAERLKSVWVPRTSNALDRLDAIARATTGKAPARQNILLVTTEDLARTAREKAPQVAVFRVDGNRSTTLYKQAVVQPLHAAALRWQHDIAAGNETKVALWLREGLAYEMAYRIVDEMKVAELTARDARDDNEGTIRNSKTEGKEESLLAGTADASTPDFAELSSVFVDILRVRLGDRFDAAWVQYVRSAGTPGFDPAAAFRRDFGLGQDEFAALARARVRELRQQPIDHLPELRASLPAVVDKGSGEAPPLPTAALRQAYENYLKGRSPKAFAYSRQGNWSADYNSIYAIERALRLCKAAGAYGCKLHAVDDQALAPVTTEREIEVVMYSKDGEWAAQVEKQWFPVIKQSAAQFTTLLRQRLGVGLVEDARIYVVSSRDDYARVLVNEIRQVQTDAERTASASDGLSNGRGQMVTTVFPNTPDDYRWQRATIITLHELVHELQGQLTGGNDGFWPQRWLTEGSADQIAYLVAKDIPLPAGAKYAIDDWRERNLDWYKLAGVRTTRPEDMLDKNLSQWMDLGKQEKAPYQMSGLMVMHLESLVGEKYYPALVNYWKLAAKKGQSEEEAFSQSFGMSRQQFLDSTRTWLKTLASNS